MPESVNLRTTTWLKCLVWLGLMGFGLQWFQMALHVALEHSPQGCVVGISDSTDEPKNGTLSWTLLSKPDSHPVGHLVCEVCESIQQHRTAVENGPSSIPLVSQITTFQGFESTISGYESEGSGLNGPRGPPSLL